MVVYHQTSSDRVTKSEPYTLCGVLKFWVVFSLFLYYYLPMIKILDGKIVRDEIMSNLKEQVSDFKIVPSLAIIKIGDNPDSEVYVQRKLAFAKKIGAKAFVVSFFEREITQEILLAGIEKLNNDESVNGIIVQSPLPPQLNWSEAVEKVSPEKDVDGLCSVNVKKLINNDSTGIIPATARGVLTLLNYYQISVKDKKVVVMGRSDLVGKPIALLMKNNGATVTVVHSQTVEPEKITREADILIVAIGKPEMIGAEYVKEGQVIIDVGINSVNRYVSNHLSNFNCPVHQDGHPALSKSGTSGKPSVTVVGDVDFESVSPLVSAISPVPGGVGPMTVASLFQNLVEVTMGSHPNAHLS
jgi:methylenetetrahydrofolate dehydrogenase (NADP+) / methenyltetrahydrofolate cyclohydrolase